MGTGKSFIGFKLCEDHPGECVCWLSPSDYIILDEFHRAGAEMWGQGVQRLLEIFPGVPVLGLSATNIRYLDNQRDMADELFNGKVASESALGEAIVRGILSPPKYVFSLFKSQNDLEKYQSRVQQAKTKLSGTGEKSWWRHSGARWTKTRAWKDLCQTYGGETGQSTGVVCPDRQSSAHLTSAFHAITGISLGK